MKKNNQNKFNKTINPSGNEPPLGWWKFRKNRYKQAVKKIQKLIEKKDLKEINKYFPTFQSELMKVAKSGVIKKKNLSRKISKISKKIKKITK